MTSADQSTQLLAGRTMSAIGTTATVVVATPDAADAALTLLGEDLALLDRTCSRFRSDSELRRLEGHGGRPTLVSPLLFDTLQTACAVAADTAGIVDPTIGSALVELGYDRDFDQLDASTPVIEQATPAPGWWRIGFDQSRQTVAVPDGVHLDLGSTGKAYAADRSAHRIAGLLDCGVLVNLGGDVAVAGSPPEDGWGVGVADHCATAPSAADEIVVLRDGGLATSGTTARTWVHGGRTVHHIVDPWTGEAASTTWALASVVASSALEANCWTTAAIVWGEDAPGNLADRGVAARLVRPSGVVEFVGRWPGVPADRCAREEREAA
jgi:FAD:protein FMN transferase